MKITAAILCFIIVIVFSSCEVRRYAYSSTAFNVPIFKKQGDSKIAASYSTNGGSKSYWGVDSSETEESKTNGLDMQAAYAVTKNIAIQANYYYRNESATATADYNFAKSKIKYKRNMLELGAGYFTPLEKKQHWLFELYAGGGFGKTTIRESGKDINGLPYSRSYNANIWKLYVEPAVTFTKKAFAVTIVSRANIVQFDKVRTDYTKNEQQDFKLDSLDRYAVLFLEPGCIGSFGLNKLPGLKLEVQAGVSILYQHNFIGYRAANLSIGFVADIRKLIKGKRS